MAKFTSSFYAIVRTFLNSIETSDILFTGISSKQIEKILVSLTKWVTKDVNQIASIEVVRDLADMIFNAGCKNPQQTLLHAITRTIEGLDILNSVYFNPRSMFDGTLHNDIVTLVSNIDVEKIYDNVAFEAYIHLVKSICTTLMATYLAISEND